MNEIIKKNGINFGIITGVISVLITSSVYIIDLSLMTKWWLGLSILAIYIVVGCVLLSKTRKDLGGYMSFKEGFTTYPPAEGSLELRQAVSSFILDREYTL